MVDAEMQDTIGKGHGWEAAGPPAHAKGRRIHHVQDLQDNGPKHKNPGIDEQLRKNIRRKGLGIRDIAHAKGRHQDHQAGLHGIGNVLGKDAVRKEQGNDRNTRDQTDSDTENGNIVIARILQDIAGNRNRNRTEDGQEPGRRHRRDFLIIKKPLLQQNPAEYQDDDHAGIPKDTGHYRVVRC